MVPGQGAGGQPQPSGRSWKSTSSPRLSVVTSQHCLTRVANWRRPRWTRDFMPDTEMPSIRAASTWL